MNKGTIFPRVNNLFGTLTRLKDTTDSSMHPVAPKNRCCVLQCVTEPMKVSSSVFCSEQIKHDLCLLFCSVYYSMFRS